MKNRLEGRVQTPGRATSELNNLLQIIGGTTELLEDVWGGRPGSEKYLQMLRTSVARAADITAQLIEGAGGASARLVLPAPEPEATVAPPVAAKRRIMIVDDQPDALTFYQDLLTPAGYEVAAAGSGFIALDMLVRASTPFDLVVLDLGMPFMDGEETFRRMRTIDPGLRVVLTTAVIEASRLESLLAEGLCGFWRKPLPADELLAGVENLLSQTHETSTDGIRGTAAA